MTADRHTTIGTALRARALMLVTDAEGNELDGNVTLTVPEPVADYFLEAAGIGRDTQGAYTARGERVAWDRSEALAVALAMTAAIGTSHTETQKGLDEVQAGGARSRVQVGLEFTRRGATYRVVDRYNDQLHWNDRVVVENERGRRFTRSVDTVVGWLYGR